MQPVNINVIAAKVTKNPETLKKYFAVCEKHANAEKNKTKETFLYYEKQKMYFTTFCTDTPCLLKRAYTSTPFLLKRAYTYTPVLKRAYTYTPFTKQGVYVYALYNKQGVHVYAFY